jgi:hypothetical protein
MSHLSMCAMMTMASVCGNDTNLMSTTVKVSCKGDHLVHMVVLAIVLSPLPLVLEI